MAGGRRLSEAEPALDKTYHIYIISVFLSSAEFISKK